MTTEPDAATLLAQALGTASPDPGSPASADGPEPTDDTTAPDDDPAPLP